MKVFAVSIITACASLAFALPLSPRTPFSRLIVFGDSLSDDGNGSWFWSNHTWPVDPAYYNHSFSNGPKWNEVVAQDLHLDLINVAVGGSTADNNFVAGGTGASSTIPVPAAKDQIAMFLASNAVQADDVLVHWTGANDVLFNPNITGAQLTSVVGANVDTLFRAGAKHVLLPTYFDLSRFPAAQGVAEYSGLSSFTEEYTAGLRTLAADYSAFLDIRVVDLGKVVEDVFARPGEYGVEERYVDPPMACLLGVYSGEGERRLCDDPEKHIFFDSYHPVKEIHALMGKYVEEVLQGI